MNILAMTSGEWIGIVSVGAPLIIAVLTFAFKAKILSEVNSKMKPLEAKVIQLESNQTLLQSKMDTILDGLKDIKELIKEKDEKNTTNFIKIYDKLDTKQDK